MQSWDRLVERPARVLRDLRDLQQRLPFGANGAQDETIYRGNFHISLTGLGVEGQFTRVGVKDPPRAGSLPPANRHVFCSRGRRRQRRQELASVTTVADLPTGKITAR